MGIIETMQDEIDGLRGRLEALEERMADVDDQQHGQQMQIDALASFLGAVLARMAQRDRFDEKFISDRIQDEYQRARRLGSEAAVGIIALLHSYFDAKLYELQQPAKDNPAPNAPGPG